MRFAGSQNATVDPGSISFELLCWHPVSVVERSFPAWRAAPAMGTPMYYAADKQKAERVLRDLRSARTGDQVSTLACLQHLRNEVACERTSDLPRMQAWQ